MTQPMKDFSVGDMVAALAEKFPLEWAEPWDRVGLVAGDPNAVVRSVMVTLDADRDALRRAVRGGHDALLTHHPAALDVALPLVAEGAGAVLVDALAAGVALVSFHTNLDRSPAGADALPKLLGMRIVGPLEASEQPVTVLTTFAPPEALGALTAALRAAGAGRVGAYRDCSFSSAGLGRFAAGEDSVPAVVPSDEGTAEIRLETTCAPDRTRRCIDVLRHAHPYEEPVITAVPGGISRGAARLGRLCELPSPETLGSLASRCGSVLGVTARVWGDPEREVRLVAVGNGSAGSLIARAISLGADVLLAGEVRYHDARAAQEAGLAVIEAGHDATEWPLVGVLASAARDVLPTTVAVAGEDRIISWWTTERR